MLLLCFGWTYWVHLENKELVGGLEGYEDDLSRLIGFISLQEEHIKKLSDVILKIKEINKNFIVKPKRKKYVPNTRANVQKK